MGQVGNSKDRNLEKKFKDVLAARNIIEDALDLDNRLEKLSSHLKEFEKAMR